LKTLLFLLIFPGFLANAQTLDCTFKAPVVNINFGTGSVEDLNPGGTAAYQRVSTSCPSDGHYTYTSYTSDCFRGDWITMEDHTPGDASGNMMLVNASYNNGYFLTTMVEGLRGGTLYEFGVWMTNVCKLSDKCPFPLLPDITIRLQTTTGKVVAQLETGELIRRLSPQWTQYTMTFTTPPSESNLVLTMIDNVPGGCGNDFALDDITFRECIIIPPPIKPVAKTTVPPKKNTPAPVKKTAAPTTVAKKDPPPPKAEVKKDPAPNTVAKTVTPPPKAVVKTVTPPPKPVTKTVTPATKPPAKPDNKPPAATKAGSDKPVENKTTPPPKAVVSDTALTKLPNDLPKPTVPTATVKPAKMPPPPPAITKRANTLFKQIDTEAGEIRIDLYDNGEIDGDTVTIYHNNKLVVSKARLSQKPVTLRIAIDEANPHHEFVMVAENLGSIPPNTSLMIVTAGSKRYEVFISSTEERNAKVVLELKR
jgi:hypothetical protein